MTEHQTAVNRERRAAALRVRGRALMLAAVVAALQAPFALAAGTASQGAAEGSPQASEASEAGGHGEAVRGAGIASGVAAATAARREARFGSLELLRSAIPSPVLEAQSAAEYKEIVRGAAHSHCLYPDTDARVQRMRRLVDRLAPYAQKWSERVKGWKWKVAVIRSPEIRMYCLPGGKVIVYSGLLDRVKLDDDELGMLLGHEIAHAVREHVRERLGEALEPRIKAGQVPQLYGYADLGVFPLGISSRLYEMRYGRDDEAEADVIGSDIAARAGFHPRAAVSLWDKLALATKDENDEGYIYVHPYTAARRAEIVKRLPDMMQLYAKAIGVPLDTLPGDAGGALPRQRALPVP